MPAFLYFAMTLVSKTTAVSKTITQRRQISKRFYTRQKEVSAASDRGESRQALDLFPNGPLGDGHVEGAILCTKNRIALVPQLVKVWVVRPHIHRKFKLADEARTADERGDTSLYAVVGDTFRQGWTVGAPAADHLVAVHVRRSVARVHAPDVRTERAAITVRVHLCVGKIIVALRISSEGWIVLIRREDKRGAFEAAASGHPAIVTGWSGTREFCPEDYPYFVDYDLIPTTDDQPDAHCPLLLGLLCPSARFSVFCCGWVTIRAGVPMRP